MNKILLSILFCFVLSIPNNAHSITNSQWLEICEKQQGMCIAYLKGLIDMEVLFNDRRSLAMESLDEFVFSKSDKSLRLNEHLDAITSRNLRGYIKQLWDIHKYCIPPKVNVEQIKKIMIKRLNEQPESLHENVSVSLLFTLSEVFPCKKQ